MIYVIAVNARIADMVARGKVERKSDYRYVREPMGLRGVRDADVYVYTGGDGPYPHDVMECARHMETRGDIRIHYVEEAELVP